MEVYFGINVGSVTTKFAMMDKEVTVTCGKEARSTANINQNNLGKLENS